jgi:hypothetical protein
MSSSISYVGIYRVVDVFTNLPRICCYHCGYISCTELSGYFACSSEFSGSK